MTRKILEFCKRPLVKDTLKTTVLNTIGKAVGFLVPFFLAAWYGVTDETDAFYLAYGLILFLSNVFARVAEKVIVPFVVEIKTNNEDVGQFVVNIFAVSGIGLSVLAGLFLMVVKPVLSVITPLDANALRLTYNLLLETAPLIILLSWTSILAGTLNSYKKFSFPAISPVFRAVISLVVIFLFKDAYDVYAIPLGYIAGEVVRLAVLFAVIKRFVSLKWVLPFKLNSKFWYFVKISSYQIMGVAAANLNLSVDKIMASWLEKGSVSLLYYATRLYLIPVTFLGAGFMVTVLSHWSHRYNEEGYHRFAGDVRKTVKAVAFITLPIMLLFLVFHRPIVKIAFGRGGFDQEKLFEIGRVWICYLSGFIPCMVAQVFVIGHLVSKNTKVLMQCAFYTVFLNILLNLAFMQFFDLAGIALATAVIHVFRFLYLRYTFYKGYKEKMAAACVAADASLFL